MALNFPSSPSEGQKFSNFVFSGGLWKSSNAPRTALPFNYFVNPAMATSYEYGAAQGTGTGRHQADQWATWLSGAVNVTSRWQQTTTPKGSRDRYRMTITNADASLAVGDYLFLMQIIEGLRVADLKWGTAGAVQVVLRFGFKGPAGTYAFFFRNGTAARSYVRLFTISAGQANTDTEQIFVVPGDTTGTWAKDTTAGMSFGVCIATGTTFQSTDNAWSAGNFLGAPGISNGMAVASVIFEFFDFGLYADPYLTGLPPPWEGIGDLRSHLDSLRYWGKGIPHLGVAGSTTTIGRAGHTHVAPMRVAPALAGSATLMYAGGVQGNSTNAITTPYSNTTFWEVDDTIFSSSFTALHAVYGSIGPGVSARM